MQIGGAMLGTVLTAPFLGAFGVFGFGVANALGGILVVAPGLLIAEAVAWRRMGRTTLPELRLRVAVSVAAALMCLLAGRSLLWHGATYAILALLIVVAAYAGQRTTPAEPA
jgi:uncharacterized membrane protein YfcA